MRAASAQLIALLNSATQFIMADLLTITLQGGAVLRYTDADIQIVEGGRTFVPGPGISRAGISLTTGVEVSSLQVTIQADGGITINNTPIIQFIAGGGFDGASMTLERVFMPTWGDTSAGTIQLFTGRVSDIELHRMEAVVTVNSSLELLNVQMPRLLYQPGCMNTLYDANCRANRAAFAVSGTVTNYFDRSTFGVSLGAPTAYYDLGVVTMTSGACNGLARTVKSYSQTNGTVQIILPWPATISPGDTFSIVPGCDKQKDTCQNKFANLINYRGFPYVPAPETIA